MSFLLAQIEHGRKHTQGNTNYFRLLHAKGEIFNLKSAYGSLKEHVRLLIRFLDFHL